MDGDIESGEPAREGRSPEDYFYLVAVPLALCGIASLQIFRAQFREQSAWKGGGFGMFASVDSPGTRFLKVYLVTPAGTIPVRPPAVDRTRDVAELRVAPSRAKLTALADRWMATRWVDAVRYHERTEPALNPWGPAVPGPAGASRTASSSASRGPRRNVRALEPGEPQPLPEELIDVAAIRVELWRYAFEARTARVRASRFLLATSSRPGSDPPELAPDWRPTQRQPQARRSPSNEAPTVPERGAPAGDSDAKGVTP